jgi:hypothetical protein
MITTVNYAILNNPYFGDHRATLTEIMTNKPAGNLEAVSDLVRRNIVIFENEELTANFPVYTVSQFKKMLEILNPAILEIAEMSNKINKMITKILISHAPKALKDKCEAIAGINNGVTVEIIESMCEQNLLFVPKQTEIVSVYGIVED